jgi:hypothetical protein
MIPINILNYLRANDKLEELIGRLKDGIMEVQDRIVETTQQNDELLKKLEETELETKKKDKEMNSSKRIVKFLMFFPNDKIQDLKVQNKALQESNKQKEADLTKKDQAAIKMAEEVSN